MMFGLIGLLISISIFAIWPAVMLGNQFSFAVGFGYFAVTATLLSIFHELVDIRQELKRASSIRSGG